jgi:hypothetical protein
MYDADIYRTVNWISSIHQDEEEEVKDVFAL